jgi:hypothetical protein
VLLFSEVKRITEKLKQRYTNDTALEVISHDSVLLMTQETEAQVEVCYLLQLRFIDNKKLYNLDNYGK